MQVSERGVNMENKVIWECLEKDWRQNLKQAGAELSQAQDS